MLQTFWVKLVAIALILFTTFTAGAITDHKFRQANEVVVAEKQTIKVGKGTNAVIKFNQDLNHATKDKCYNAPMPDSVRKLL